jgi:hypothetical protein
VTGVLADPQLKAYDGETSAFTKVDFNVDAALVLIFAPGA